MQHIIKKYSYFNYPKVHLIIAVILLAGSDIIAITKLIPYVHKFTKNFIPLCTAILSISFILLYSVYILYNLNIIKKHLQKKSLLSKKINMLT